MKNIFSILSVFFLMAATAQTADQVVDQYIKAMGGAEKIAQIKSIQKKDTMTANGMNFPVETYQDTSGKIYSTMKMGGQNIILMAFDGQKGFVFDNQIYGYKDIPSDKVNEYKNKAKNMFGYFYRYKEAGHQLKYKGKQTKDGKNFEVIDLHLKEPIEGGVQDLTAYFDANTHLLSFIEVQKNGSTVITRIKGYKEFEGVKFPLEVVTEVNGMPLFILKTGDVKINAQAPSKEKFKKPNN